MSRDRDLVTGTTAAVVAASLFGLLGPLARFGERAGMDGVAFTAWRAVLGTAFLAALIVVRRTVRASTRAIAGLDRRGRASLGVAAATGVILNAALFSAFQLIPIALALMLFYLYPAGVVVAEAALGREAVTPTRVIALILSSAGAFLVVTGGGGATTGAPLDGLGVALGLLAAGCQVVFVLVSRSGYRSVPADAAMLVNLATVLVVATLLAFLVGQGAGILAPMRSLDPWPFIVLAGVASAGVSSLLFLTAIRRIGGTRTGILMLLEPVVGAALAALLLGEALGPVQVLGGALVLAGALVLQLRSVPEHAPLPEAEPGPVG
jgi:drug/metabolite transporter, DME family